ncbi:MAG: RNA-dependent DNA polymerase [Deltaproteobacteria bacterium]|nr:RNA-dependent DNA polymerase [Deltaproteobacteria bacterium]
MKRYGNLWDPLVSFENLSSAAKKACKGKRELNYVRRFNFDIERELVQLQTELVDRTYRPGPFRSHWISRPKPRMISAAPFRDRVVHHALMNLVEPILDRHFHPDSYACRKGKGTHAAVDRLQGFMKKRRYLLQCDIRKFFPSIDHEIMKEIFRNKIKDRDVLRLMDLIVDHSNAQEPVQFWFPGDDLFTPAERKRGLPIGNLTSQWFANWYLDGLDHYVTSALGVGCYVRYCDDFILLHNDKRYLHEAIYRIQQWLYTRRLRLHPKKLHIRPVKTGVRFVGYRIWPSRIALPAENVRGFQRRLRWIKRAYGEGTIDFDSVKSRMAGWLGHARHADSKKLIARLSLDWVFRRYSPFFEASRVEAERRACVAWRLLEQQSR